MDLQTYRDERIMISNDCRFRFLEDHLEKWMNGAIFSIWYLLRGEETATAPGGNNLLSCQCEDGFNTHDNDLMTMLRAYNQRSEF